VLHDLHRGVRSPLGAAAPRSRSVELAAPAAGTSATAARGSGSTCSASRRAVGRGGGPPGAGRRRGAGEQREAGRGRLGPAVRQADIGAQRTGRGAGGASSPADLEDERAAPIGARPDGASRARFKVVVRIVAILTNAASRRRRS
jgi:hypothetical protein